MSSSSLYILSCSFFSSRSTSHLVIVIRLSTQRTSARITALEPLEQTLVVEDLLAGRAALRGKFSRFVDDGIANCTLDVAFEGAGYIFAPCG